MSAITEGENPVGPPEPSSVVTAAVDNERGAEWAWRTLALAEPDVSMLSNWLAPSSPSTNTAELEPLDLSDDPILAGLHLPFDPPADWTLPSLTLFKSMPSSAATTTTASIASGRTASQLGAHQDSHRLAHTGISVSSSSTTMKSESSAEDESMANARGSSAQGQQQQHRQSLPPSSSSSSGFGPPSSSACSTMPASAFAGLSKHMLEAQSQHRPLSHYGGMPSFNLQHHYNQQARFQNYYSHQQTHPADVKRSSAPIQGSHSLSSEQLRHPDQQQQQQQMPMAELPATSVARPTTFSNRPSALQYPPTAMPADFSTLPSTSISAGGNALGALPPMSGSVGRPTPLSTAPSAAQSAAQLYYQQNAGAYFPASHPAMPTPPPSATMGKLLTPTSAASFASMQAQVPPSAAAAKAPLPSFVKVPPPPSRTNASSPPGKRAKQDLALSARVESPLKSDAMDVMDEYSSDNEDSPGNTGAGAALTSRQQGALASRASVDPNDKRERNKVAAERYRIKKRMMQQSANQLMADLKVENSMLKNRITELENEVRNLRSRVLAVVSTHHPPMHVSGSSAGSHHQHHRSNVPS